jgi:hypothetical protein
MSFLSLLFTYLAGSGEEDPIFCHLGRFDGWHARFMGFMALFGVPLPHGGWGVCLILKNIYIVYIAARGGEGIVFVGWGYISWI